MALVEKENVSVDNDDLTQRYEQIAAGNPDMLGRIREYYTSNTQARDALASEIKEDKAVRFLLDKAVITEVEPAAKKTA